MSNANFRLMKRYLPGPYTFILPATGFVPKKISPKRKTVGVRMPDYPAVQQLVGLLDEPIANTSINVAEHLRGDGDEVKNAVMREVEVMLDAGRLPDPVGSTIVDLTGDMPILIRQGKGKWE
jgi:tRNA threonylcarbamoyl adenosine modification protein (Sua5/YciO/YrdC/YwlC family)